MKCTFPSIFMTQNDGDMGRVLKGVRIVLVFICIAFIPAAVSADARVQTKKVLLLHSYHQGNKWTDDETAGVLSVLGKNKPGLQLSIEYMDTKKLSDTKYFGQLIEIYKSKYSQARFDVIIAADDNAFFFLRDYRDQVFQGIPVVFCGVNYFIESYLDGVHGFTGVNEEADLKGAIDIALSLHPKTKNMVLITDATETGRRISDRFHQLIPLYGDTIRFRVLDDLDMEAIQDEVARLASDSLVLFTFFFKDRKGQYFEYYESTLLVTSKSRVPVYGAWDYSLGHGIVGGLLTSGFDQGKVAGEIALRILGGEKADHIPIMKKSPNRYFFDYTRLASAGIKASDLPPESILVNSPVASYEINKRMVWSVIGGTLFLAVSVVFLLVNISRRKSAEAAFLASEKNFHTLVDNLRVGVFRSSGDVWHGHYLQVNQAMLSMFGYDTFEEFEAIPVASLYQRSEDRMLVMTEVLDKGYVKERELAMQRKDGTPITVSCTATVHYNDKGAVKWLDGVMEDVTQRKSLEEQFRHAQKMEAVGTLAGGIAHDFNNLLTALMGYANLAMVMTAPHDARYTYLNHILSCSEKAADLTRGLLAFSRKQVMKPKLVDLNCIVKNIEPLLRRLLSVEIDVTLSCAETPLNILADSNQFEQVLMNLATNARDAMPGGGKFSISTELHEISSRTAPLCDSPFLPGSYALLTVSDTGSGMSKAIRHKIFEPFFTTKEMGRGTGLGLSTVYGIVKQHNGEIEVTSELEKGTSFGIFLPIHDGMSGKAGTENTIQPPKGGSETLLVAEDNSEVRDVIVSVLSMAGYTVIPAVNGEDALRQFSKHRKEVDLVLTDVLMPKLNGKDAVAQMSAIKPYVKVLFMSGNTANVIDMSNGADEQRSFICKPMTPSVLLGKIREILDGKTDCLEKQL